jgi:hypothetical protein
MPLASRAASIVCSHIPHTPATQKVAVTGLLSVFCENADTESVHISKSINAFFMSFLVMLFLRNLSKLRTVERKREITSRSKSSKRRCEENSHQSTILKRKELKTQKVDIVCYWAVGNCFRQIRFLKNRCGQWQESRKQSVLKSQME